MFEALKNGGGLMKSFVSIFVIVVFIYGILSILQIAVPSGASGTEEHDVVEETNTETSFVTNDEMNQFSETTSNAEIRIRLADEFQKGRLMTVKFYTLPGTDRELVLATPTETGKAEQEISCHFSAHAFCTLFLKSSTGTNLILWGDDLTGFNDIEPVAENQDIVIISTSWSFYNYTEVARKELDLMSGELKPRLIMELDMDYNFVNLQISGYGDYLSLIINGTPSRARMIPETIELFDKEGAIVQSFDEAAIALLQDAANQGSEPIPPIFMLPGREDLETLTLKLQLYGKLYELDLNSKHLTTLPTI